jgi:hypothetical protein
MALADSLPASTLRTRRTARAPVWQGVTGPGVADRRCIEAFVDIPAL